MDVIKYEDIINLLSTFRTLRANSSENNKNAVSSLNSFFQSGINFGALLSSSNSLITKVNNSSEVLDADYDRIIKFLEDIADKAKNSHTQSVTRLQATEIWNVQESMRG